MPDVTSGRPIAGPGAGAVLLVSLVACNFAARAADTDAGRDAYLLAHDTEMPCTGCHDDAYFRDPSNRTAASYFELRGWVQGCSQEFPQGWFPEDEDNVAAYLNREYYHFAAD
jgi:hypothetical protein